MPGRGRGGLVIRVWLDDEVLINNLIARNILSSLDEGLALLVARGVVCLVFSKGADLPGVIADPNQGGKGPSANQSASLGVTADPSLAASRDEFQQDLNKIADLAKDIMCPGVSRKSPDEELEELKNELRKPDVSAKLKFSMLPEKKRRGAFFRYDVLREWDQLHTELSVDQFVEYINAKLTRGAFDYPGQTTPYIQSV